MTARHGRHTARRIPDVAFSEANIRRFWSYVDKSGDCWIWIRAKNKQGYGVFGISHQKTVLAHRFAFQLEDPYAGELDHRCRTRACVRKAHLRPATLAEQNANRDLRSVGENMRTKTHCPNGHPYDETNTYQRNGRRHCRSCRKAASAARYAACA